MPQISPKWAYFTVNHAILGPFGPNYAHYSLAMPFPTHYYWAAGPVVTSK